MRTTTLASTAVRSDVLAVRRLLGAGTPQAGAEAAALEARSRAVILGGARAFGQVGVWNAQVLKQQARTGLLFTPSRSLSGDEVTDKPELIEAKLSGRAAQPPVDRVDHLRAAYSLPTFLTHQSVERSPEP